MSKMSELMIDVEEMLNDGIEPVTVAKMLDIPLDWVLTVDTYINGDIPADFDDVPF